MQKNFKDFTVGEMLDLGLNVDIKKHGVHSLDDGIEITRLFEGTKQSTEKRLKYTLATAWKGRFHVDVFVNKEETL